jgi:uncharacterized Fe-S radical SAM superfamily protein PflX
VASEETGFGTIKCPYWGGYPISEAIHHQIAERTRQEFKAEAIEAKRRLAAKNANWVKRRPLSIRRFLTGLPRERANLSREIEARLSRADGNCRP